VGVDLIGRHGVDAVSTEEIARAAGVSKSLLYHYFPDKNEFLSAVLDRSYAEVNARFEWRPELTVVEQFDRNLDSFLAFVDERAAGYLAATTALRSDPRVRRTAEALRQRRIEDLIAVAALVRGTRPEELRRPLLDVALEGWLAYAEGVIVRWLSRREIGQPEVHALLRRSFLETLDAALTPR
jgi:AcrR family transcriptional regulator